MGLQIIRLIPVDPAGVYAHWDWIRNGLLTVISKSCAHYRPEDVYRRLRDGSAWLYLIRNDDDIGFCVLTQEIDADGMAMFIWCLWCEPGSAVAHKAEIYEELYKLGASIKAKRIRFWSPLRGWEREHWADRVATVFEKEIL